MGKAKSKEKTRVIDSINTLTSLLWYFYGLDFLWVRMLPGKHNWKNIQQQLGPQIYVCLETPCQGAR